MKENEKVTNELECFYVLLKKYRMSSGMSQTDLADRAKLHRTYISELENGKKTPSLQTLIQLAGALHLKVWQLLYFDGISGPGV